MPKIRLEDALSSEEDWDDYYTKTDDTYFEKLCGACMFFNDDKKCPFFGKVMENTRWNEKTHMVEEIKKKCNKFND